MRKFICAAFVVLVGLSFVVGGEYAVTITKVEDGKTVFFKKWARRATRWKANFGFFHGQGLQGRVQRRHQ